MNGNKAQYDLSKAATFVTFDKKEHPFKTTLLYIIRASLNFDPRKDNL